MGRLKKAFLSLILLALAIFVIELVMRRLDIVVQITRIIYQGSRIGEGSDYKLSDDPVLLYEWSCLPQTTEVKKQKGVYRIIVLGDSVVYGKQWPLDAYFPEKLESLLNSRPRSLRYEVINMGIPGYNTKQEARYLETRLLPFSPDMVIIGYTVNDRVIKRHIIRHKDGLYCSDIEESYPYLLGPPARLTEYLMRNSICYRFINYVFIKTAYKIRNNCLDGRVDYFDYSHETEEAVKKIRDIALMRKFDLLFVIFPNLSDGVQQYESDWIINKCRQYSIEFIDLRGVFKGVGYEKIRILDTDRCHPNQLGHRLVAEEIFQYLKNNAAKR